MQQIKVMFRYITENLMDKKERFSFTIKGSSTPKDPFSSCSSGDLKSPDPWFCVKTFYTLNSMEEHLNQIKAQFPSIELDIKEKFVQGRLSERRVYRLFGGINTLLCVYVDSFLK
jgi:hypothetical protein